MIFTLLNLLAATDPFGKIAPPEGVAKYPTVEAGGLGEFLNNIFNLLVVVGGIYALLNFILAGYAFMSAGDDPKQVQAAWGKIWQTLIGLIFVAGAFVLAALFGQLIFGDPSAILSPTIPTP